jgi:hypothetical protein
MRQRPPATRTAVPGRPSMTSARVQAARKVVARLEIAEISRRRAARPPCYSDPGSTACHPRIFFGWYVISAVGLVLMTTTGVAFYNLAVLLDAFVGR